MRAQAGQGRKARPAVPWFRRRRPRPKALAARRSARIGGGAGVCISRQSTSCSWLGASPDRCCRPHHKPAVEARACVHHCGVHGGQVGQINAVREARGHAIGPVPSARHGGLSAFHICCPFHATPMPAARQFELPAGQELSAPACWPPTARAGFASCATALSTHHRPDGRGHAVRPHRDRAPRATE